MLMPALNELIKELGKVLSWGKSGKMDKGRFQNFLARKQSFLQNPPYCTNTMWEKKKGVSPAHLILSAPKCPLRVPTD